MDGLVWFFVFCFFFLFVLDKYGWIDAITPFFFALAFVFLESFVYVLLSKL